MLISEHINPAAITKQGKEMLIFQKKLAEEYGYNPIGYNLFLGDVREKYLKALPDWCKIDGDVIPCYTLSGTLLATGYKRIVIGDYGAFVEFEPSQILAGKLIVQPGQEYRIDEPRYAERVKYQWLTVGDHSGIKIYFQQKTVSYADYVPGMYYISPYEIYVQTNE